MKLAKCLYTDVQHEQVDKVTWCVVHASQTGNHNHRKDVARLAAVKKKRDKIQIWNGYTQVGIALSTNQCLRIVSWQTKCPSWLRSLWSLWPVSVTHAAQKPEELLSKDPNISFAHTSKASTDWNGIMPHEHGLWLQRASVSCRLTAKHAAKFEASFCTLIKSSFRSFMQNFANAVVSRQTNKTNEEQSTERSAKTDKVLQTQLGGASIGSQKGKAQKLGQHRCFGLWLHLVCQEPEARRECFSWVCVCVCGYLCVHTCVWCVRSAGASVWVCMCAESIVCVCARTGYMCKCEGNYSCSVDTQGGGVYLLRHWPLYNSSLCCSTVIMNCVCCLSDSHSPNDTARQRHGSACLQVQKA